METFTILILVCVGVVINLACLPFIIKQLAELDLFFTLVQEGRAKAIMGAGGKGFQRFIWQYRGHALNTNTWDVEETSTQHLSFWEKLMDWFGMTSVRWLGLPGLRVVYEYTFRWNSLHQSADDDKVKDVGGGIYFKPHEEKISFILLQEDIYYARVEQAEDQSMVPLNVDFIIRVKVKNPYKALFGPQEWLEMTWAEIIPAIREMIAESEWQKVAQRDKDTMKKFNAILVEGGDNSIQNNLLNRCGVNVVEFRVLRISPGGERASMYEQAATEKFRAKQEAKRIRILAEAERDRIKQVYGEIAEHGKLGEIIQRLEALKTVADGPSNTIISAPELSAIAQKIADITQQKP